MKQKKNFTMLCIAAVATVSGYVGMKTYQSNADDGELLMENVEAMSQSEGNGSFTRTCNIPADPLWCNTHYQVKWTYTKEERVAGKCICTAKEHDCCKAS